MSAIAITESEILEALRDATKPLERNDALSLIEIAEMLGTSEITAYRRVRKLFKAGLMECVQVRRQCMDGVIRPRPGYRLLKPKGKKRR